MRRIRVRILALIYTPLIVAMTYHGIWNMTQQGETWWINNLELLPLYLRYITGSAEILIVIGLLIKPTRQISCLLGAMIMIGAVIIQLPNGYSYKYEGFEPAFVYACLFIYCFVNERKLLKENC